MEMTPFNEMSTCFNQFITKLSEEILLIHSKIDRMSVTQRAFPAKDDSLEKEIESLKKQNDQLLLSVSAIKDENENFINVNKQLTARIQQLKSEIENFKFTHEQLKECSTQLKKENAALKKEEKPILTRRQAEEQLNNDTIIEEMPLQNSIIEEPLPSPEEEPLPSPEEVDFEPEEVQATIEKDYLSLCRNAIKSVIKTNDSEKFKLMRNLFKDHNAKNIDKIEKSQLEPFYMKLVKIHG